MDRVRAFRQSGGAIYPTGIPGLPEPDRDRYRYVRNSLNFLRFFGRLNPGSGSDQAQAELTAICGSLRQQFPVDYARKYAVRTVPLREALIADFRQSMLLLLGAVLVV